ncbi:MAG: hypothetical protein AVDCRST_MAG19-3714, partial [uncultured Thermomicrobiales bacterium]
RADGGDRPRRSAARRRAARPPDHRPGPVDVAPPPQPGLSGVGL